MAKRGRKASSTKKGYFYETEETAVINYLNSDDDVEREKIFNKYLLPAFTKMIESIIRRYNLYIPDEDFNETFDDTISFLMTKLNCFKQDSGYKAYSYCGTICKNYLILKINKYIKNQQRNVSYENMRSELDDSLDYGYDQQYSRVGALSEIIEKTSAAIKKIMTSTKEKSLSENEIKVGNALVELLDNWEDLFAKMGSNKFNKSSILLFLKETTFLTTKEIRDSMKKYKQAYQEIKKNIDE